MLKSASILTHGKTEILFFGKLRELSKSGSMQWPVLKDTDILKAELFRQFPEMKDLPFLIAVNKEIIHSNAILHPGDIVALLPPYAGG